MGPLALDPKRPGPQASILHFHKASPTVMVTQNHTFPKNIAQVLHQIGIGLRQVSHCSGPCCFGKRTDLVYHLFIPL